MGERDESVYELTAERFGNETLPRSVAMRRADIVSTNAALRLANREYQRAIQDKAVQAEWRRLQNQPGRLASLRLSRQKTWLTDQDLRRLFEMIRQIETHLATCLKRKQGGAYVFTTLFVPLVNERGSNHAPLRPVGISIRADRSDNFGPCGR